MNILEHLFTVTSEDRDHALHVLQRKPEAVKKAYRSMMTEIPNLHKFLNYVRDKSGPVVLRLLWLRIWTAMERDSAEGTARTIAALCDIPEFDQRVFLPLSRDSRDDSETLVTCYISMLNALASRLRY